jgi:hypothetical protein
MAGGSEADTNCGNPWQAIFAKDLDHKFRLETMAEAGEKIDPNFLAGGWVFLTG